MSAEARLLLLEMVNSPGSATDIGAVSDLEMLVLLSGRADDRRVRLATGRCRVALESRHSYPLASQHFGSRHCRTPARRVCDKGACALGPARTLNT